MKKFTRITSIVLTILMLCSVLTVLHVSVNAASYTGKTGDLTWTYDKETYTLSFEGEGKTADYTSTSDVPWKSYVNAINNVYFGKGVTGFCTFSLYNCTNIRKYEVHEDNQYFTAINNQLYSKDTTVLVRGIMGKVEPFVKEIGEYAFLNLRLEKIELPDSVEKIGKGAFRSLDNLTYVDWSENCKTVPEYCFYDCVSLTEIKDFDVVETFESFSFANTAGAKVFALPKNLTTIGDYAFKNSKIPAIKVYNKLETIGAFSFKDSYLKTIIVSDGETETESGVATIPSSVKTIGHSAFYSTNISKLVIPEGVETIGESAFEESALSTAEVADTIQNIGKNVVLNTYFEDKEENVEGNVVYFGKYAAHVVDKCRGEVVLRDDTIGLAEGVFSSQWYMTKLTMPATLKIIPEASFPVYKAVTEFVIDENNPYFCVENSAVFSTDKSRLVRLANNAEITEYVVPDTVTRIDNSAFSSCESLVSVSIPDTVTYLGNVAFNECTALKNVNIPESITTVPSQIFTSCSSLETVYLHNKITEIGFLAFDNSGLKEITIPESVTKIGFEAFETCNQLKEIVVPDSVTNLQYGAFRECVALEKAVIGAGVKSTNKSMFYGCTSLKTVEYKTPQSTLGEFAFAKCEALETVDGVDSVTSIGKAVFQLCSSLKGYTVPKAISAIPEEAFFKASNITVDATGGKLKTIGIEAFYGCTGLNIVSLGSKLKKVEDYAFGSSDITSVTIPGSVTDFGENIFRNCLQLTEVKIEEGVKSVPGYCFYKCENIESVVFPESVTYIHHYAFAHCDKLKELYVLGKGCGVNYQLAFAYTDNVTDIYIVDSEEDMDNDWLSCEEFKKDTVFHYNYDPDPDVDISEWQVNGIVNKVYNGKTHKQNIVVTDGVNTANFDIEYQNNKNAGTAKMIITGKDGYCGQITKTFKIAKAQQKLKVKVVNKTTKYSKLKNKKQVISGAVKASGQKGKVTYAEYGKSSKLSVNSKTGAITVKKNTKKGEYKIKVRVSAKATADYKSCSTVVTVKIRVK